MALTYAVASWAKSISEVSGRPVENCVSMLASETLRAAQDNIVTARVAR
jgi:hypothetical protein